MAADRELVLGVAADRVAVGENLGALPQRDRPLVGMARIDHPPAERRRIHLLMATLVRLGRLLDDPRGPRHRLDATGDHQVGVADRDLAAGTEDSLHPRATQPIRGGCRHRRGEPGEQHRHAHR